MTSPWHHIQNPELTEILTDIKRSLDYRNRPEKEAQTIIELATRIAKKDLNAKESLGFLCFLCEHGYANLLNCKNITELTAAFDKKLMDLFLPLVDLEKAHRKVDLQDCQKVSISIFPRLLARAIVSSPGVCNVGILSRLKVNFSGDLPFHKQIQFVLNALEQFPLLRNKLRSIEKPLLPDSPANEIIRINEGLGPCDEVSEWDAQKTALSAILTDLRQGRVGSCFATFLAIDKLSSKIDKTLEDFHDLIRNSALNRGRCRFPILLEVSLHYQDRSFLVTSEGKMETNAFIWESPGLLAACQAADISNPKQSISRTIQSLYKKLPANVTLTINAHTLLKEVIKREIPYTDHRHLKRSMLAFESQTNHLLLRVWEAAIANMAESDDKGYATNLLIESLYPLWILIPGIREEFNHRAKFLYDMSLKQRVLSNQEDAYYGTFVLHDTRGLLDPADWVKITTPELFIDFITDLIRSHKFMSSTIQSELIVYVQKPSFLEKVLKNFQVLVSDNPLSTPWLNSSGNDPLTVYRNYHEICNPPATLSIEVNSAEELLNEIVKMIRKNGNLLKHHLQTTNRFTLPVFINNFHACRCELTSPLLLEALKSDLNQENGVAVKMMAACQTILRRKMTFSERSACFAFASVSVVPQESWHTFFKAVDGISLDLTLVEFRAALLKCFPKEEALNLDYFIFNQVLSNEERQLILRYSIPFLDTNWADVQSVHHIYMAFVVNPGSGRVEFWKLRSDGLVAAPIDQSTWTGNQSYTFIV